jgi:hypothetical protein
LKIAKLEETPPTTSCKHWKLLFFLITRPETASTGNGKYTL